MPSTLCNPQLIDDFLAERLTNDQRLDFEQHLDECDACCEALQRQTADVTLWDDARNYLSSTSNLTADATDLEAPKSDSPKLDFLAPTDDPHMLGRFAGYEISGVIGCGGMGIVLKGYDTALSRYAAIKVLSPHYASSGAARQRFAREAQAAAAVVHDNVIAIHGVDEFNQLPYLVMPYVKGESLQKRIDRTAPLSIAEVLRIASQTAKGLAAAHDQGLVHRDIKPANILLPANVERVIITDFGLARAADDASLTRSGVIAGTPQYMSPEQARGDAIDHRSDLFSLGSMMYAMCTGHPPFRAESPYGILRRITDNEPRSIREINVDVPDWLEGIIQKLLRKNSADRYSTATEVAALLEDCLAHVQQPTLVPLPSSLPRPRRTDGRRRKGLFGTAVVMSTAAIAFVIMQWPPRDDSSLLIKSTNRNISAALGMQTAVTPSQAQSDRQNGQVSDLEGSESTTTTTSDRNDELSWNDDDLDQIERTISTLKREFEDDLQ